MPERSSGVLRWLYLCRRQTERKNIHIRGNGGRVRGVEKWRLDCLSETANLELCNRKNSSCQNATLAEFRVLSVFARYPSQKDVSKRGRRDPLTYAQRSQGSGRAAESSGSGGRAPGLRCTLSVGTAVRRKAGAARSEGEDVRTSSFLRPSKVWLHVCVVVGGVLANVIGLFYICFDSSCFMFLLWKKLQPSSCHF